MIDLKTIQHIAQLARLQIGNEQAQEYAEQLGKVMDHFQKVSNLATDGVAPLITPTEIEGYWRDDEVEISYSSEEMLQNAPSRQGHLFKVPPVV